MCGVVCWHLSAPARLALLLLPGGAASAGCSRCYTAGPFPTCTQADTVPHLVARPRGPRHLGRIDDDGGGVAALLRHQRRGDALAAAAEALALAPTKLLQQLLRQAHALAAAVVALAARRRCAAGARGGGRAPAVASECVRGQWLLTRRRCTLKMHAASACEAQHSHPSTMHGCQTRRTCPCARALQRPRRRSAAAAAHAAGKGEREWGTVSRWQILKIGYMPKRAIAHGAASGSCCSPGGLRPQSEHHHPHSRRCRAPP